MQPQKLDRDQPNKINAHQADQLYTWESMQPDRQNLTLRDRGGNDVLTVFALTYDQLADLYVDIGHVLGKSPDPTIHHLKQIHDKIGALIDAAESDHKPQFECNDSFANE